MAEVLGFFKPALGESSPIARFGKSQSHVIYRYRFQLSNTQASFN